MFCSARCQWKSGYLCKTDSFKKESRTSGGCRWSVQIANRLSTSFEVWFHPFQENKSHYVLSSQRKIRLSQENANHPYPATPKTYQKRNKFRADYLNLIKHFSRHHTVCMQRSPRREVSRRSPESKLLTFNGTPRFITLFSTSCHWNLY